MKLSSNLERVADRENIARKARKLNKHPALPEILLLTPMQEHAMAMFRDSVDAYVREDAQAARAIIPQDKALDKMNAQVSGQLIDGMARDPEQLRGYINLMFIARHPSESAIMLPTSPRTPFTRLRPKKTSGTSKSPPKRRSRRLRKCSALIR